MKVDEFEVSRRVEEFKSAIQKAGAKLTHQRLIIFQEVASSLEHPDAETVFRAVRKQIPTISLDTVYRTLNFLSDLGVVSSLSPCRERMRFDANLSRHHHYVCLECGKVMDFKSMELDEITLPVSAMENGSIVSTHVEVRGICNFCLKRQTEKTD
ncbi:MAG: hypothetical protein AMXMBFR75_01130 [Candidatus Hinthialibacteria bacterium]|nr:transcriptional repressor [bacterium]NUP92333.1 transcriptional repressor [Candidatus Omnitrophota bacterium]